MFIETHLEQVFSTTNAPALPLRASNACQSRKQKLLRFMFDLRSRMTHVPTVIKAYNGVLISLDDRSFTATIGGAGNCPKPCWNVVGHRNVKGYWDVSVANSNISFENVKVTDQAKWEQAPILVQDVAH